MTPLLEALSDIEERLAKATPGNRRAYWNEKINRWEVYGGISGIEAIARFAHCEDRPTTLEKAKGDAELDANAPTDLRRCLEIIKVLDDALTQLHSYCSNRSLYDKTNGAHTRLLEFTSQREAQAKALKIAKGEVT